MDTETLLVGRIDLPRRLAIDLMRAGDLPEAAQGPLRTAVKMRLDSEREKLESPISASGPDTVIRERLATIRALRWVLDLSESARRAIDPEA